MNALMLTDGYKTSHHKMYPEGTTLVFSNFTPRSSKYAPQGAITDGVIVFGVQMALQVITEQFNNNFFKRPKDEVISEIKKELELYLNMEYDVTHFEQLYDLGYLPIEVRSLQEGTLCPIGVPMLTIHNTHPDFYWITNYLETLISNLLWKPVTSATISYSYYKLLKKWANKTSDTLFVDWQGHDFSMRGLDSIDATVSSGMGHLTSFLGTDSIPAIAGVRKYYGDEGFIAGSVPASEHSVMCAGSKEDELETFKRLLKTYPKGILSVVSDTWDLWKVITEYLPILKEDILSRDGKLVIRPDSGDPVDILCGKIIPKCKDYRDVIEKSELDLNSVEYKGVIELLWDIFGGTINEKGYKVLDPHIGAIYGDSITLQRAEEICKRLEEKGFASTNVVLGIGSFTYQYNTRDSYGMAMKATFSQSKVKGSHKDIVVNHILFKDPITDDGVKKSARGLLKVKESPKGIELIDNLSNFEQWKNDKTNLLKPVYLNGNFVFKTTFKQIRERIKNI